MLEQGLSGLEMEVLAGMGMVVIVGALDGSEDASLVPVVARLMREFAGMLFAEVLNKGEPQPPGAVMVVRVWPRAEEVRRLRARKTVARVVGAMVLACVCF
jgi:hypothetical protein